MTGGIDSLMLVPFHTLPGFVKNIIEGYSFKPSLIKWLPDEGEPPGTRLLQAAKQTRPASLLITHGADYYLDYPGLEAMVKELESSTDIFCVGIHPYTIYDPYGANKDYRLTRVGEQPNTFGQVSVWRAEVFYQFLAEALIREKNFPGIEWIDHLNLIAIEHGFRAIQSVRARLFYLDERFYGRAPGYAKHN